MRSLVQYSFEDSLKIQSKAVGYIAINLLKPGDAVFISNNVCHITEITNNFIIGFDLQSKNKQIKFEITDKNKRIRFLYLDPHIFNDRKVFVDAK